MGAETTTMHTESGASWFAVSLADGLEPATSTGIRLRGQEIVLWRDSDGVAHAWEDRCPHRGMRLSLGFVRGNHIACLYHGWQYDAAGQCRYIPAHPELVPPASIRTVLYPCREWLGMIWIHSEPNAEPPAFAAAQTSVVTPVRSITADCPPERLRGALIIAHAAGPWTGSGLLRLHAEGHEIFAAIQPITETRTALHVVIAGIPADVISAQTAVAQWAEQLRRDVETLLRPAAIESAKPGEVVQWAS
jgi:nitrite reductase/ring-hydroxylating ferredoxin subunit